MKKKLPQLNRQYLESGDAYFKKRLKDPEFKKAYEEESLKFKIAQVVCQKRRVKKYSQAKLAEITHTTQKVISRIERGKVSIGVNLLSRIANALDLKVSIR